jgi:hypothetical protein
MSGVGDGGSRNYLRNRMVIEGFGNKKENAGRGVPAAKKSRFVL